MEVNSAELIGPALDWAIATSKGYLPEKDDIGYWLDGIKPSPCYLTAFTPTTNRDQGYEIIEQEEISIIRAEDDYGVGADGFCNNKRIPVWAATTGQHEACSFYEHEHYPPQFEIKESDVTYGPTQLIAGLRCVVAKYLGNVIDVPDELVGELSLRPKMR